MLCTDRNTIILIQNLTLKLDTKKIFFSNFQYIVKNRQIKTSVNNCQTQNNYSNIRTNK